MKHAALVFSLLLLSAAAFAQNLAFQGFETDIGDWTPTTTRVPSGGGILHLTAASGSYYAEVQNIDGDYSLSYGLGPPYLFGDSGYSYFGFATTPLYPGDFSQSIKMYVDVTWPVALYGGPGVWIDMSPGHPPGNYGGEHNFRLTPTGSGTVAIYVDGQLSPIVTITTSGWYNFQETFQKGAHPTDLVNTSMNVFDPAGHLIGTTAVVSDSLGGPLLSQDLKGPDYVWITVWPNGWAGDVLGIDDVRADLLTSGTPYFVNYYSNANTAAAPDASLRIINDGSSGGNLYAAIYVLDDSEELQECCACLVTPDGVLSESVDKNLTANPLTGVLPRRGVIKVISSSSSDPTAPVPTIGLRAWGTHIHGTKVTLSPGNPINPTSTGPYFVTESRAADSNLGASEAATLGSLCYYDGKLSGKLCTCQPEDNDF